MEDVFAGLALYEAVVGGVGESHGVIKFSASSKSCVGCWYPESPGSLAFFL